MEDLSCRDYLSKNPPLARGGKYKKSIPVVGVSDKQEVEKGENIEMESELHHARPGTPLSGIVWWVRKKQN